MTKKERYDKIIALSYKRKCREYILDRLLDILLLFGLCFAAFVTHESGSYDVVIIIVAVIFSSAAAYFNNIKIRFGILVVYAVASIAVPQLLYLIPLICYPLGKEWLKTAIIAGLAEIAALFMHQSDIVIFSSFLIAMGLLMAYRTTSLENSKLEYADMQDTANEKLIAISKKNKELLERQDYQINVATLSERNRIARDIHDSVGHILSRSLLQVAAMIATTKDEIEKEKLRLLKDSLSEGLDSIRASLHNLYDESIDLYGEVREVIDNYKFCKVTYEYDIENNPDKKIKYAFIAVIKEALTNIEKHSGATAARVTIREQPAFYSLCIADNGHGCKLDADTEGIGMKSIEARVSEIGGIINYNGEKGFRIYITVQKGDKADANSVG